MFGGGPRTDKSLLQKKLKEGIEKNIQKKSTIWRKKSSNGRGRGGGRDARTYDDAQAEIGRMGAGESTRSEVGRENPDACTRGVIKRTKEREEKK